MAEQPTQQTVVTSPSAGESQRPPLRAKRVAHAFKWLLAIVGVFVVVCIIQVVVSAYGSIWLMRLGRISAGSTANPADLLAVGAVMQLVWLAVAIPWWRHVRRRGMGIDPTTVRQPTRVRYGRTPDTPSVDAPVVPSSSELEAGSSAVVENSVSASSFPEKRSTSRQSLSPAHVLITLVAIALMGIGLQIVISLLITVTLPLFPEIERSYTEMMQSVGTDAFTPLSVLSVAVLAPIVEELTFRGVVLQFALRAVTPAWNKRLAPGSLAELPISNVRFWIANVLQALAFGVIHLNITQGVYAFAIGLVLGWLFGRTGQLRYSIALHLAINFSSYFVDQILGVFGFFGGFSPVVLSVACAVGGIWLFARTVSVFPWSAAARSKSLH